MIDEKAYEELKQYRDPHVGRNRLLAELGYIEMIEVRTSTFLITSRGEMALREYEMYAERNRLDDDRRGAENDRNTKFQIATLIVSSIGTLIAVVSFVLNAFHII